MLFKMWFFKRKSHQVEKLEKMNTILTNSFAYVKQDMNNTFQWLNYLYQKNLEHEKQIQHILNRPMNVSIPREDIKQMIDEYYAEANLGNELNDINSRIGKLEAVQAPVFAQLEKLTRRVDRIEEQRPATKAAFKARIIKKISRNAKEYMKNIVLSMIRKYEKISALQLREIIVEEQGLCSKSSFYRLLEEIEKDEEVTVVQEGKEKHYLYKILKRN